MINSKKFVSICKLLSAVILLLLFPGCWDRIEIEERGFFVGAAIDLAEKKDDQDPSQYSLTYQMVVPRALGSQNGGGSSGSTEPYFNLTSTGDSMIGITRQMASRTSRTPFAEHLKIILVSEQLAQQAIFSDVLDVYLRDHEMRRSTKVIITDGTAKSAFVVPVNNEQIPAQQIDSISENKHKSMRMLPPQRIGDVHEYLLTQTSFVVPYLHIGQEDTKVSGAAVFSGKENKMAGYLDEEETMGLNFVQNQVRSDVLKINKDEPMMFEIKESKTIITSDISDPENIVFTITVKVNGNMSESSQTIDPLTSANLKKINHLTEVEIERLIQRTGKKVQGELQVDAFQFSNHIRQNHYQFWQSIKDDWEQGKKLFTQCEFRINVKASTKNVGTSKRSEK